MAKSRTKKPAEPERPLRLEWRSPAELAENPANWRTHPEAQLTALADVISEVGFAGACLFNEATGRLIDGHARKKVALDQGSASVPVLVGSWTEEQERKILATLDPLAAMAEADTAKLAALLAEIDTESEAVQNLLDSLAHDNPQPITPGAGGDEFDATPEAGPTRTQAGNVWLIGGVHRLLVGDCTGAGNLVLLTENRKADAVLTDPPYDLQTSQGNKGCFEKSYKKVTSPELQAISNSFDIEGAFRLWQSLLQVVSVFVFCSNRQIAKIMAAAESMEWSPTLLVWHKYNSIPFSHGTWRQDAEFVIHCKAGGAPMNGDAELKSKVKRLPMESQTDGHPTVKPVSLIMDYLQIGTDPGAVVFDGYLGSGTTLIAAHRLGRVCYGCEIEPKYADVILRRAEAEGLTVEKVGNG